MIPVQSAIYRQLQFGGWQDPLPVHRDEHQAKLRESSNSRASPEYKTQAAATDIIRLKSIPLLLKQCVIIHDKASEIYIESCYELQLNSSNLLNRLAQKPTDILFPGYAQCSPKYGDIIFSAME